jgi:AcrR family transcriptional regulator
MRPQDLILNAARSLLVRNGYAGLSMRELSRDSGLAKGTIYYYFQDKQAIYFSVIEQDMLSMGHCLADAAQVEGDCIQRLRSVVETYFEIVRSNRSLIIARMREISGMEEQMRLLVQKHRCTLLAPVTTLITEGIGQRVFRPLDTEMAAISLFAMINSFATHRLLLEQIDITPMVIEHTLELFLRGIAAPGFDLEPYLHSTAH